MSSTRDQLRAKLLDYCMGLLPVAEEAQVERAMLDDSGLAEEAQRLRDLLQVSKRADALEWTEARSSANFAAISAALGASPTLATEQVVGSVDTEQVVGSVDVEKIVSAERRPSLGRGNAGWLVAAAVLLIGVVAGFAALRRPSPASAPRPTSQVTAESAVRVTAVVPAPAVAQAAAAVDVWASLPRTAARPAGFPGAIFASDASDWRAQAGPDWTVYIAEGALLVEWMPAGSEHLFVRTPNETIEVTGTVFAVEVAGKATEVSVVEGSVVVSRTDGAHAGERAEVVRGGRWRSDAGSGLLSGAVSTAAGLRIDLAAHRAWMLAHRRTAGAVGAKRRAEAPKPSGAAPTEAGVSQDETLSKLADEALAQGEHSLAAALLEQWVAKAPAASTRRAAQLDLARIYLYELRQPERGAVHLRALLDSAPSDRLATTLRSELCSLRLPKDAPLCGAN